MDVDWLVACTVLVTSAVLLPAVPVFSGLVEQARERQRKWNAGEIERYREDEGYDSEVPTEAEITPRSAVCSHCGSVNDVGFVYCGSCVRKM